MIRSRLDIAIGGVISRVNTKSEGTNHDNRNKNVRRTCLCQLRGSHPPHAEVQLPAIGKRRFFDLAIEKLDAAASDFGGDKGMVSEREEEIPLLYQCLWFRD